MVSHCLLAGRKTSAADSAALTNRPSNTARRRLHGAPAAFQIDPVESNAAIAACNLLVNSTPKLCVLLMMDPWSPALPTNCPSHVRSACCNRKLLLAVPLPCPWMAMVSTCLLLFWAKPISSRQVPMMLSLSCNLPRNLSRSTFTLLTGGCCKIRLLTPSAWTCAPRSASCNVTGH
eukprot:9495826-Pyramimonas_sp.AAC.1